MPTDVSKIVYFRGKQGTDRILQRIASEHEPALRRFLRARLSGHPDHEDLVQETFLRVVQQDDIDEKLSRGEASTRSYLFSIATNLIRDRFRKDKNRQQLNHVLIVESENRNSGYSVEEVAQTREQLSAVKTAILKLRPECREAFVLSRFHGLSYREIADRMGLSISMVEKHIMLALKRIRTRVDRA